MPKKKPIKGKPKVNKELDGFEIKINTFGEIKSNFDVGKLNTFLDDNVEDKKLKERDEKIADNMSDKLKSLGRPIRVLVAKVGLDGHDRGAKVIANTLKDAGMEVIYTGLRQTPQKVVNAALQEDVDVIGVSILSGAHMTVFPKLMTLMMEKGIDDVLLTGGGIIPEDEMNELRALGVGELFPPGTKTEDIVNYIVDWVIENRNF